MSQLSTETARNGGAKNGETPKRASLPDGVTVVSEVIRVPINRIRPNPKQPRDYFDEGHLRRLATSMGKIRQLNVIKVRRIDDDPLHDYEIVNGEQRWRAKKLNGDSTIDCVLGEYTSEIEQFFDAAVSNVSGSGHTRQETARAYHRIFKELPEMRKLPKQQRLEFIAAAFCTSVSSVKNYLDIHERLHPDLKAWMDPPTPKNDRLSLVIALQLCKVPDHKDQMELALKIREENLRPKRAEALILGFLRELGEKGKLDTVNGKPRRGKKPGAPRNPSDEFKSMRSHLSRARDGFAFMCKKPLKDLDRILSTRPKEEIVEFVEDLDFAIAELEDLRKAVETVTELPAATSAAE